MTDWGGGGQEGRSKKQEARSKKQEARRRTTGAPGLLLASAYRQGILLASGF
jgi:hypothetical protein